MPALKAALAVLFGSVGLPAGTREERLAWAAVVAAWAAVRSGAEDWRCHEARGRPGLGTAPIPLADDQFYVKAWARAMGQQWKAVDERIVGLQGKAPGLFPGRSVDSERCTGCGRCVSERFQEALALIARS
jgi:hypothetical protein